MRQHLWRGVIGAVWLFSPLAFAEVTGDAVLRGSGADQSEQSTSKIAEEAKPWGLSSQDYQHYLKEMAEGPNRLWWKEIDPPQVLGMNAKTDEERMKYAKIEVELDQERAEKEIEFQHTYTQAFRELYPNAKPISEAS